MTTKEFTIKEPDAPATRKQLWMLHTILGIDSRGLQLTIQEASDKISIVMELQKKFQEEARKAVGL